MNNAHASRWTLVAAAALASLISAEALGDDAPYKRGPVKIDLPALNDKPGQAPPVKAPPAPAPTVKPDDIIKITGTVQPIRKKQIEILDDLIADCADTGCDADDVADFHFRKAELYALEQRYYRLETQRVAIAADQATTAAAKAKLQKESDALAAAARKSLLASVRVYKVLAADAAFKNYANMPKALFFYGYTLGAGGYPTEMREVLERLLREYPSTDYAAEAHLAFADYHFDKGELADAAHRYTQVLKFPKSPVFWYAKYKLGWVELNAGEHQDALEVFHDVATGTKGDPDREVLHRAAKNDIVRAYAEVGNVRRARDYFKKLDGKGGFAMYELLADILHDAGKSEKAVYVYRDLIGAAPTHRNVCLWQDRIATSVLAAGSKADAIDEIGALVKLYVALASKKSIPAEELAECRDLARDMSDDMARTWHAEWAKTYDPDTYALSDKAYAIFLGAFRDDARFAESQYFRAELAWSRADREATNLRLAVQLWDDAADRFVAVVDAGVVDKQRLEEAARAAVLATVNARLADPRKPKLPPIELAAAPGKVPAPQPIPDDDRKVLAAFDLYLTSVKDKANPERTDMIFYKADLLRRYEHLDDALPLLREVASRRAHRRAEDAINLMLDTYNRLARYDELVAAAKDVLADTEFLATRPAMKSRLVALEVTHERKAAERLEAEGRKTGDLAKLIACGKAYAELYNRDTEAAGADELLYDAAVCFEDGKSVGLALDMYKKLEDMGDAAREDIRARAVGRLGVVYARVAQYAQAAKYLELYYAKYAGVKGDVELVDAKDALSDAVIYRKGTGDDALAIKDTQLFVKNRDAKPAEKAEAFFSLYAVYDKQGDTDALIAHLRKYIAQYGSSGGPDRLVHAHARLGLALWTASCPGALVDGSCVKVRRDTAAVGKRGGKRVRSKQDHCGEGVQITVIERDARKAKDALAAFAKAIAVHDGKRAAAAAAKGASADDTATAAYWYALARFYALEARFEAYLGLGFPANLDFDPKREAVAEKSMKRFDTWYVKKQDEAKDLKTAYQAVIAIGEPQNAIAAAARVGQIAQNASDSLFTAEIPANLRPYEEAVDRYCETLENKTLGLIDITVDAYGACLDASTKLGWFSDWSRMCERELGNLRAGSFPRTTERRATPNRVSVITDVEPRVTLRVE
jgi:hypothetical protein